MDNKQLKTYIEQQITIFENASKEAEKKLYANEEIASDIRILRLCDYIRYNAYLDILKQIAYGIEYDLATKKFFKEKEEQTQIANPIRKELIVQLEELVNPAQSEAIKEIEKDLLSPINNNNNISFVTWMHRIQGVIQVVFKTPEYTSETKDKIYKIINKLIEMKCL